MSLGRLVAGVATFVVGVWSGQWQYFIAWSASSHQARIGERDRRRAVAAYNSSVRDRLEMVDLSPDQPRTKLYGRVRFVEGVRKRFTSGTNSVKLTLFVSFAGVRIDAFEKWYLFDDEVTLDGSGYVQRSSFGTGKGYTTNGSALAKGATSVPLISGSGTILAGDLVQFEGDGTRYKVSTGITGAGTLVLQAPGLLKAIPASAVACTVYQTPYHRLVGQPGYDTVTLNGSGGGTFTMSQTPVAGSVEASWYEGTGENRETGPVTVGTVSGTSVTLSGGRAGASAQVCYTVDADVKRVRIRSYLGTSTQTVGADLAADYGGKLVSTDDFAGIALAVIDYDYDPDVFPQGRATPTALIRGAWVYDPRLDSTVAGGSGSQRINNEATWAWSENPALIAYDYARWAYGWALPASAIMSAAEVAAEANICDAAANFLLSTGTVSQALYTCGMPVRADADPATRRRNMDAIMATMAGADGWDGGVWRFRAGRSGSSAATLDTTWLATRMAKGGKADNEPVLRGANAFTRTQRINRVSGSCVDPAQRYQSLPFPTVQDAVLVAAQGPREQQISYEGVNNVARAQHLASVAIRQAQAGSRIEALCNLKAYRSRLFDVHTVLLPRQGMDVALNRQMEVIGRRWSPRGGIRLQLAEISANLFDTTWSLNGRDPAPDSNLRRPWQVEDIAGLAVTSATAALTDTGSIITRVQVSWTATTGDSVRNGGAVEVQYTLADEAVPSGDNWPSWEEPGAATKAVIPGLQAGRYYLFRARAVQKMPLVRGAWSTNVMLKIGAPIPVTASYSGSNASTISSGATGGTVTFTPPLGAIVIVSLHAELSMVNAAAAAAIDGKIRVDLDGSFYGEQVAQENLPTGLSSAKCTISTRYVFTGLTATSHTAGLRFDTTASGSTSCTLGGGRYTVFVEVIRG